MKYGKPHLFIVVFAAAFIMSGLSGCGRQKHKLILPFGFESDRTAYAAGEKVTVLYGFVPADTLINFYSDADDLSEQYSDEEGYAFTFTMPDRDVTFWVESRNLSEYKTEKEYTEGELLGKIDGNRMVFDYYDATVATVDGDSYTELALYEWDEDDLLLVKCVGEGSGQEIEESMRVCRVPPSYRYDCLIIVNRSGMKDWHDGSVMLGSIMTVKFKDSDGNLVCVSSDDMPEGGGNAFYELESLLKNAWSSYGPKPR